MRGAGGVHHVPERRVIIKSTYPVSVMLTFANAVDAEIPSTPGAPSPVWGPALKFRNVASGAGARSLSPFLLGHLLLEKGCRTRRRGSGS